MSEKVVFPYASLSEASKDKYRKIGGPEQAFRFLVKGYKSILWRKRADANAKAVEDEQDAKFIAENPKATLPTKKRTRRKEKT